MSMSIQPRCVTMVLTVQLLCAHLENPPAQQGQCCPPSCRQELTRRLYLEYCTESEGHDLLACSRLRQHAPGPLALSRRSEERTRTHHIKRVRTSADFLVPVVEEASCNKSGSIGCEDSWATMAKRAHGGGGGGEGGHLSRKIFRRTCHCRGTALSGSTCRFHRTPPR